MTAQERGEEYGYTRRYFISGLPAHGRPCHKGRSLHCLLALTTRILLAIAIGALYLLHQDFWFWRSARPLVFGFLPIGLAYHALYCVAIALLMWVLTKVAWPAHLERD